MTAHHTVPWVWRQMIEASPWGQRPRYLIHDRDRIYDADIATRVGGLGRSFSSPSLGWVNERPVAAS